MKKIRQTKTGGDTSIVNGQLFFEDCLQCQVDAANFKDIIGDGYTNSIRVISLDREWQQKITLPGFLTLLEHIDTQFTMRREIRSGRGHWYAYRKVFGKLHKRYVGTDEVIDQKMLLDVARKLPSK